MKRPKARFAPLVVALVVANLVAATPVAALDLYKFKGTVRDAIGRSLEGATVSDGGQYTQTNAAGYYELGESSTGTFNLFATRWDMDTRYEQVSVTIPLDVTVNFTLLYELSGALSRTSISTASAPGSATLTVSSFAPNPGTPGGASGTSCVGVHDSRTGATTDAVFVAPNPDGSSRWEWDLEAPWFEDDGAYTLAASARDCSSGTALTSTMSVGYRVDNRPPSIPAANIVPRDHSTTVFASAQPLVARVSDPTGTGVDPGSIRFTLTDLTSNTTTEYSGGAVTLTSGWARTNPVTLVEGHRYWISVEAADAAGNVATTSHAPQDLGGGFSVSHLQTSGTLARIAETVCTVSSEVDLTGFKTATCTNVPLAFDPTTFTAGPAEAAGTGFVDFTAALTGARMRSGLVEWDAYTFRVGDNWGPKTAALAFDMAALTSGVQQVAVQGRAVNIGTLQAKVPATWTDATLAMGSAPASVGFSALCADPSQSATRCSPDPTDTRHVVYLKDSVTDLNAVAEAHEASLGIRVVGIDEIQHGYVAAIPSAVVAAVSGKSEVETVAFDPEFGYKLSGAQLLAFDITDTPRGVTSINRFENDPNLPEPPPQQLWCISIPKDLYI